jgi:hypothetical protein
MAGGILSPRILHDGAGHFKRAGWHYMAFLHTPFNSANHLRSEKT